MPLEAHYFDGQSSRRRPARLSKSHAGLLIENEDGGQRAIPIADIRVSEPQGAAPRTLRFEGDNAFCEVAQGAGFDALLLELGYRAPTIVHMQSRWRWVLASLLGVILVFVAGYLWGLPWGAKVIAPHVPVAAMRPISEAALEQLDEYLLKPSAMPEERREKLQAGFLRLAALDPELTAYDDYISLNFRSSPGIGPNAFVFPDGQIVLLDELANLHDDDDEILAVLAHELGHLRGRHGVRQLIQSSVVAAVAAAWLGDISFAAVTLGSALLSSGYSRDMEREADDYAAELLRRQGKSPELLVNALEKLEMAYRKKMSASDREKEGKEDKFLDWISSHPNTDERIRRLRCLADGNY
ncbi:MAG: M48 family metallopeptidase [Betaproteobacteria bacterium]|nr:M48 family metallopeptidase [Betaproteobacteria bacterium]